MIGRHQHLTPDTRLRNSLGSRQVNDLNQSQSQSRSSVPSSTRSELSSVQTSNHNLFSPSALYSELLSTANFCPKFNCMMCLPCCFPFADVYLEDPPTKKEEKKENKKEEEEEEEEEKREYMFVNDDAAFYPVSDSFHLHNNTIPQHPSHLVLPIDLSSYHHITKHLPLHAHHQQHITHHQDELLHLHSSQGRGLNSRSSKGSKVLL